MSGLKKGPARRTVLTGALLSGLALAGVSGDDRDVSCHNAFAEEYNRYIEQRKNQVLDIRTIKRMRKAWRDLEKSAGWPEQ